MAALLNATNPWVGYIPGQTIIPDDVAFEAALFLYLYENGYFTLDDLENFTEILDYYNNYGCTISANLIYNFQAKRYLRNQLFSKIGRYWLFGCSGVVVVLGIK